MIKQSALLRIGISMVFILTLTAPASAEQLPLSDSSLSPRIFMPVVMGFAQANFEQIGTKIDLDAAKVGDILAAGEVVTSADAERQEQCVFPQNLRLNTAAPADNVTKWTIVSFDDKCNVILHAKWKGSLKDSPVPFNSLETLSPEMRASTESEMWSDSAEVIAASPNASFETNEQYIITYGYPGTLDELTRHTARMTYTYDGVSARRTALGAYCTAQTWPPGWDWVTDSCSITGGGAGPAATVNGNTQGSFHCTPPSGFPCNVSNPDGYYHSLYSYIEGNKNGISNCGWTWTGQIARGPQKYVVQGCS